MSLTIVTNPITAITTTTATSGGNTIMGTVTGSITAKGVCWDTSANPTIALSTKTNNGTGNANFSSSLTSLTQGTTYYVRSYVTDGSGTYYGANVLFTTLGLIVVDPDSAFPAITEITATSGATSVNGFTSISAIGVCWNTSTTPTISNSHTTDTLTGNSFISFITGLLPGTLYYIRAYVTNAGTTYYSAQQTFTTVSALPIVTTTSTIASITISGASVSGNVASSGGSTVTARGIQYSLIPDMSSGTTNVSSGTGTGGFSAALTGLTLGTTYYVRAYATNSVGTSYGVIYNFTTLGGPTVITVAPYSITNSTARTGCIIVTSGGSAISGRGVVISTSPNPTTSTGLVISDLYYGNLSSFLITLKNLLKDTTYHVRAYATNAQGTGYGNNLIFSTKPCNPLIENCNPQEEPAIECSEQGCEFIIPMECIVGNISEISCANIPLNPEENNLVSELYKINEVLCSLSSKDFMIYYLSNIITNASLKTIFCNIRNKCTTINASVIADIGALNISITSISPTTYALIGRTITCGTPSKFTVPTTITGFVSGVNGGVGVYTISTPVLASYTGTITLSFV